MREAAKLGYLIINQPRVFNQPLPSLDDVEVEDIQSEKPKRTIQ
jgi:hypothetical protein